MSVSVSVVDIAFDIFGEDEPLMIKQVLISDSGKEIYLDPDEVHDLIRDLGDAVEEIDEESN